MIKKSWRTYFNDEKGAYGLRRTTVLAVFLSFLLIKVFTWGTGYYLAVRGQGEFNAGSYFQNFHHLRLDDRVLDEKAVSFFQLWNYADSEWYLSIAESGYPSVDEMKKASRMADYGYRSTVKDSYLKYAFFPLFPGVVSLSGAILPLETAAFAANLLINVLLVIVFLKLVSLYFPEQKESVLWPFLLLFLFPFSVFYSLYFPESLFLLLSISVFICLKSGKYILMALFGFLLSLTRPNGMFIALPVLFSLYAARRVRNSPLLKEKYLPYLCALAMPLGFAAYLFFCYLKTGHWNFYSIVVKAGWNTDLSTISKHVATKISFLINFSSLPLHWFHESKIDTLMMVFFGAAISALWLSKGFPRELTIWATMIWAIPFLSTNDLMGFSRYMSVSFPVFLFLGLRVGWARYPLLVILAFGYFFALRTVIRYEWLG